MSNNSLLSIVNASPSSSFEALQTVYHDKVYIVGSLISGYVDKFFKTRKGAEGYIERQTSNSYYDEYSMQMVACGSGLTIAEVHSHQITDATTNKQQWYKYIKSLWFKNWVLDNILYDAKRIIIEPSLLTFVSDLINHVKNENNFPYIEELENETISTQTQNEIITEETTEQTDMTDNVTITLNEQMNGVEITFPSKPNQLTIDSLKANGFRWSKKGFWYAKQSEKTLSFANNLIPSIEPTTEDSSYNSETELFQANLESQQYTYPEIDIDDLNNYIVSDELQRRLHSNSMFTVDYKQDCINTFQNIQNDALQVLSITEDARISYQIKKYLQSFKKRYYESYIKILNHKANNPSWVVTGRGGLNVRRYNKMQERYDKYLGESVQLSKEYKKRLYSFKSETHKIKQKAFTQAIENNLNNTDLLDVFKVEKKPITVSGYTDTVRTYNYQRYSIAKSWGMFRIFYNGKEIETNLKTTDTLTSAKKYVLMLINQS